MQDNANLTPITAAVYGKKQQPKPSGKPKRAPRGTTVGESITPHEAAALVALKAELEGEVA